MGGANSRNWSRRSRTTRNWRRRGNRSGDRSTRSRRRGRRRGGLLLGRSGLCSRSWDSTFANSDFSQFGPRGYGGTIFDKKFGDGSAARSRNWNRGLVGLDFANDVVGVNYITDSLLPPKISFRDGLCKRRAFDDFLFVESGGSAQTATSDQLNTGTVRRCLQAMIFPDFCQDPWFIRFMQGSWRL